VAVPLKAKNASAREARIGSCAGAFCGRRPKPTLLKKEERSRARGKNWLLCWGVTVAQAGMPVLLKPVAIIPF
jgi:hypothetical protein